MSIKDFIFKQHTIGQLWGKFALAGSQIAIFVSGYTFLMVSVNAYEPVNKFLEDIGWFLQFWQYMAIIVVPILLMYLFAWKFLVKSFYLSWADQFWQQSKDHTDNWKKIKEQNDEIIKQNNDIIELLKQREVIK
jgi:hypothetical protein